jgi:hypothetical protein
MGNYEILGKFSLNIWCLRILLLQFFAYLKTAFLVFN